jgi:PAS domain S-box-containing protein
MEAVAGQLNLLVMYMSNEKHMSSEMKSHDRTTNSSRWFKHKGKDIENKLQESEESYRIIFDHAMVGLAHVGLDGRWLQINQKLCDITGYTSEELRKKTFQEMTFPEDLTQDQVNMNRILHGEIPSYTTEKRYFRKDQSLVWVNLTVSLVHNRAGTPLYFLSIIEDINARKQVEEKLVEQASQLYDATVRMEEFLGVASHELRTPLTSVKANIQLAQRRLKSAMEQPEGTLDKVDAAQSMLMRAERQVGVLNRLISDMVDISRIQSGRLQLQVREEPCNLVPVVLEAAQEQQLAQPSRTIHAATLPDTAVWVLADPDRITQVVNNYLTNALKYSAPEKPVDVNMIIEESNVRVMVRDYGQGLSEEDQQRVWECFYQSPNVKVLSGSGVGLGLGLYLNRVLIDRHQGHVGVESTPGEGSIFWFSLPLAAAPLA